MVSNSLKIALSKYLVKMSDTCRSPPNRITQPREVVPLDNIVKTAQSRRCYKLQGGITEFSRQLRAENDNRLLHSRLRGAGGSIPPATVCKDPPPPSIVFPPSPSPFERNMRVMRGQIVDVRAKIGLPILVFTATPLSCQRQGYTLRCAVMTRLCAMEMMTARAERIWSCSGN